MESRNNGGIDRNQLLALSKLSDKDFAEIIKAVIKASGGSDIQTRSAMAAAPIIKAKLKNASDKELNELVSFIGEANAKSILNNIPKE